MTYRKNTGVGVWRGLPVAIKVALFPGVPSDSLGMQMLASKASEAFKLKHPNIVATYSWEMQPIFDDDGLALNTWKLCLVQVSPIRP